MGNGKIIAVINQKGGVGKTTTTINLGLALHEAGMKVLLVDSDPQAQLTVGLGLPKTKKYNMDHSLTNLMNYAVIMGKDITEVIDAETYPAMCAEGVAVLPSNKLLAGVNATLQQSDVDALEIMGTALAPFKELYDYILIDGMPTITQLNMSALAAADSVIIPMQPEYYSMDGLFELVTSIETVNTHKDVPTIIEGILYNMDTPRLLNTKSIKSAIQSLCEGDGMPIAASVFETTIPNWKSYKEASSAECSIFKFEPNGTAAERYRELAKEILEK